MKKLVMFDIDGTLTKTDGVDTACFVQAFEDVFGFTNLSTDWAGYPHCSDSGIMHEIFEQRCARVPSPEETAALQARFMTLLTAESAAQPFQAIPGAGAMLGQLDRSAGCAISLASGAWECSARLKLASAGLHFPHLPAAFSDDAHAREEIMQASLTRATQAHRYEAFDAVVYVGDGVWDARAAANLGYPFIGIASDPAKAERLIGEGAKNVFPDYLNAAAFLSVLEISESSSARLQAARP